MVCELSGGEGGSVGGLGSEGERGGEVLGKGIANDWVTIRWSYPQEVMDRIAQCTVCLCQGGLEHVIMAADVSCFSTMSSIR